MKLVQYLGFLNQLTFLLSFLHLRTAIFHPQPPHPLHSRESYLLLAGIAAAVMPHPWANNPVRQQHLEALFGVTVDFYPVYLLHGMAVCQFQQLLWPLVLHHLKGMLDLMVENLHRFPTILQCPPFFPMDYCDISTPMHVILLTIVKAMQRRYPYYHQSDSCKFSVMLFTFIHNIVQCKLLFVVL